MKDEGKKGDRDFLQWDTISLMSLLGIYVIISYYKEASISSRFNNKITKQRFDVDHIKNELFKLHSYHSSALHWNLEQIDKIGEITKKSLDSYRQISQDLKVEMHNLGSAEKRIKEVFRGKENFMNFSRKLAKEAQGRERETIQPKEHLIGIKGTITIKNYLGGYYYFTCDEVELRDGYLYLIEGKHTKTRSLPSLGDIKDGLLKMILYTNLKNVKVNSINYCPMPVLKLTTEIETSLRIEGKKQNETFENIIKEANKNNFKIIMRVEDIFRIQGGNFGKITIWKNYPVGVAASSIPVSSAVITGIAHVEHSAYTFAKSEIVETITEQSFQASNPLVIAVFNQKHNLGTRGKYFKKPFFYRIECTDAGKDVHCIVRRHFHQLVHALFIRTNNYFRLARVRIEPTKLFTFV